MEKETGIDSLPSPLRQAAEIVVMAGRLIIRGTLESEAEVPPPQPERPAPRPLRFMRPVRSAEASEEEVATTNEPRFTNQPSWLDIAMHD